MTRLAPLVALALIAGCATPQEVIDQGLRSVHELKSAPAIAAPCLARNAENDRALWSTTVRPLDRPDRLEVILRTSPEVTIVVAHVEPNGIGSRATIWLRSTWFYRGDELVAAMAKDC